jgi:hypothetical protein
MKLILNQDWTFASGLMPVSNYWKCQSRKLLVTDRMLQGNLHQVKVPAGEYNVGLTSHAGEVWLVLDNAGTRRKKNIAVGVILSVFWQYKGYFTLTTDDGSPISEQPTDWDEQSLNWGDSAEPKQNPLGLPHAWFSLKQAEICAPAVYKNANGNEVLVTCCGSNKEESRPGFNDSVYRGLVTKFIRTERNYKEHPDFHDCH